MRVQFLVGLIPCGFNSMWVQSCASSIPWGSSGLGSILFGFNPVWVQFCAGSIPCGFNSMQFNSVRVQSRGFNSGVQFRWFNPVGFNPMWVQFRGFNPVGFNPVWVQSRWNRYEEMYLKYIN